jgi:CubicO group peptidase (beta-lactamase class C family)
MPGGIRGRPPPSREAASQIEALMHAYEGDVPGASLLVLHEDEAIVRRAYGCADLEHRVAASRATNYRLASLTKQFTAAAVLLLVEESRLSLDAGIRAWLPSLPAAADPVTLRHLLTHTSGVLDYEELIPASRSNPLHDADVLQLLESEDRTYFPPGTSYRYSNSGYAVLALAVAAAAGMDFASVLRTRIFAPLGMHHTVAHEEGVSTVSHRAFGYSERHGRWLRTDQNLTSAVLGDGGIYSSSDDWEKWDAALADDRLLRPESLRLAFTPATSTDDPSVKYGFGWRMTADTVWHSGESIGFRNAVVRFPERRLTVLVLTNRDEPGPYPIALRIAEIVSPRC